jgi:FkbM family methyltransferase
MIKKTLFRLLSVQNYLRILHVCFHWAYTFGTLRKNHVYKYHYFVRHIIRPGDVVLDIGANIGHYTRLFAGWTGPSGRVHAIEPIGIFADVIRWGTKRTPNIMIHNVALGEETREVVLSNEDRFGYLRTGIPRVLSSSEDAASYEFAFNATMKKGSELFGNLNLIDFIKCDIEGYEAIVLPEMKALLLKFKPAVLVETWGAQKDVVESFLKSIGYHIYDLEDGVLKPIGDITHGTPGDQLYVHAENDSLLYRLAQNGLFSGIPGAVRTHHTEETSEFLRAA